LEHGLSNCDTRTTTGKPTNVYWFTVLIKIHKYEKDRQFTKRKNNKPQVYQQATMMPTLHNSYTTREVAKILNYAFGRQKDT
jgi:hypothetical protein